MLSFLLEHIDRKLFAQGLFLRIIVKHKLNEHFLNVIISTYTICSMQIQFWHLKIILNLNGYYTIYIQFRFLHSIMLYINVIDMQIRKGCSIEFLSIRVIFGSWRIYKENVRRARLMRRSLQVKYNNKKFVFCMLQTSGHPTHSSPIQINTNNISTTYIYNQQQKGQIIDEFVMFMII